MTYTDSTTDRTLRQHAGRLLLIEDHHGYLNLLRLVFTHAAFDVTAVSTFHAATQCLQTTDFDVVISDYRLGDGTGDQLLRQAHQQSSRPLTVLMSTDQQVRQYARACQADAWYFKRQPRRRLMASISDALQERDSTNEPGEPEEMDDDITRERQVDSDE
jgi:DNA-binding NtrC family response regulator